MPTYEYRCRFCHQMTDAFQRMSDAPLITCPHCGKDGLERIVSGGAGVIYKGEGWYVTDYSKKSSGGKESAAKPDNGNSDAKSGTGKTEAGKTDPGKPEQNKSSDSSKSSGDIPSTSKSSEK